MAEHSIHSLRIGPRRLGGDLRSAQLRGRHHLHGLGDLLRRLGGGDAIAQVLQAGHGLWSGSVTPGLVPAVTRKRYANVWLRESFGIAFDRALELAGGRIAQVSARADLLENLG